MLLIAKFTVFFLIILLSYVHEALSIKLRFSHEPRDAIVGIGQAAVFDCRVSVDLAGRQSIVWMKDGSLLRQDDRRRLLDNGSLLIRPVQRRTYGPADEGRYRCRVTLPDGRGALVSREARLQVAYLADVFSMEPLDATRRLGESVSFRCSLRSVPDLPQIRWLFQSSSASEKLLLPTPLKAEPGRISLLDDGRSLELNSLTPDQLGLYFCSVSLPKHLVGSTPKKDQFRNSKKALLKLRSGSGKAPVPLSFELSPMDVDVPEGETAELLCSANGRTSPSEAGRKPLITWLFGSVSISIKSNARLSLVGSGSLRIAKVTSGDAGVYTCRASLPSGAEKFVKARLRVLSKPAFTRQPGQEIQGFVQQELTLQCAAQGNPEPTVEWRKNGLPLSGMDEYFQTVGSSLRIVGLLSADAALYQCLAANSLGNVQTWTQLSVNRRPTQASTPTGEPLTPPGVPLGLKQMTVGRDYVHLEWQPPGHVPPSDQTMAGQLSYDVVWRKRGHERVRQRNTTSRGLLIDRLSPNTAYDIEVYAVLRPLPGSVFVRSLNSARLAVMTLKPVATPLPVENLRTRGLSSHEVRIQWENPADSADYVQHYKILIYNVSDPQARLPQNLTVRPRDPRPGAETLRTVSDLHPYALYRVLVFGVNASGRGVARESRVRTKEAKPEEAPQNVSVQVTGSRTVTVRWLPPPTSLRNGEIVAYKLRYKLVSPDGSALGKAKVESLSGEKTGFSLSNLERDTAYMVKLSARTAIGPGPFSPWVKFRTMAIDPDGAGYENRPPGAVEGLDARGLPNAIVLSWFKPDGGRTRVTKYIISWGRLHDDESRQVLPGSRQEYTIRGLEHSVTYIIRIDPYNEYGVGKSTYKDVTTRRQPETWLTDEDKTSIPLNLRSELVEQTTAILSWDDPDGPDASRRDGRMYELRYYPTSGVDRVSPSRPSSPNRRPMLEGGDLGDEDLPKGAISVNVTSTRARVARLRPNTKYEFKVRTIKRSSGGKRWVKSVWSFVDTFTTREDKPGSAPQELTLTPVAGEPRSIKLAWQPPLLPNGHITRYIIYFTADRNLPVNKWVKRTQKGTQLNLKLPNLDYDILYYVQIRAGNKLGAGPFSPIRIYKTPDEAGRNGGPVRLAKDYYDLSRVPTNNLRPDPTYGSPITDPRNSRGDDEEEGLGGGLGDKTWWVIIGAVFGAAMLLIICIIICLCWCRPNAFMFAVNQRRTANGYKLGSKVPSDSADGSLEPAGKVTPLPPPSLKPPDLFTHRAPAGEHPHYEMERRDSESGSDSVRFPPTAPNGMMAGHQRAHVRIGSQGQPIKPKPMLLPVQDAMQPPRDPVAMVTAIGGPAGVGRGMMPAPNGHMPGPAPFHRAQFAMSAGPGPVGAPVPMTNPGPRVNASEIASQPSSEELQPLMSSSQISQPGLHQSPRYPEYTTYSPGTTVVYDNATVKSSGSEKSSGTEGGLGSINPNMRGPRRGLATSPSGNHSFVPPGHHRASRHPQSSPGSGESPNSSPHFHPHPHPHPHPHHQQQQPHPHHQQQQPHPQPGARPRTVAVQPLLNGVPKPGGSPFHNGPKTACMANVGGQAAGPSGKPLRPAPVLAEGGDSASEISRGYSTEKLNQEMANLEGLMKDLNAMTQKEFEC